MRPLPACCLILGLVVSFLLGRFTSEAPLSEPTARVTGNGRTGSSASDSTGTDPSAPNPLAGQGSTGETEDQLLAQSISRCTSESTGVSRFLAVSEALQKIDASNWRRAFEITWRARLSAAMSESEYQLFLQRIGEVGGVEAMLRFRPKDPITGTETHSGRYAMQGWAQRDPEAARAWLETQPTGRYRSGMLIGYLRSASLQDANAAFATLRQLAEAPDSEGRLVGSLLHSPEGASYAPLFQAWIAKGGASSEIASGLFDQLVDAQLRTDWNGKSEAVQRWFEPYLHQSYVSPRAVNEALRRMNDLSPEALMPWVERLPAGDAQKAGVQYVLDSWVRSSPDALAQWLTKQEGSPHHDLGVQTYLTHQRGSLDEPTWRKWLEKIQDPQIREATQAVSTASLSFK